MHHAQPRPATSPSPAPKVRHNSVAALVPVGAPVVGNVPVDESFLTGAAVPVAPAVANESRRVTRELAVEAGPAGAGHGAGRPRQPGLLTAPNDFSWGSPRLIPCLRRLPLCAGRRGGVFFLHRAAHLLRCPRPLLLSFLCLSLCFPLHTPNATLPS